MKVLTREEYIAKKNKLEEEHTAWLIKNAAKREKYLNRIIKEGIKYFTRWINNLNTFEEPRSISVSVGDLLYPSIIWLVIDEKKSVKYDFKLNEFYPIVEELTKAFPYLDIKLFYYCGFNLEVSLKEIKETK